MPTLTPLISPVDYSRVSSDFGTRVHPVTGKESFHSGIDLAAPTGTPVVAPTDIQITSAGFQGANGNLVRSVDGQGNTYAFAHLNSINVKPGDTIAQGQQLGTVGSTGRSTGPHLHFGIKDKFGRAIDPENLLKRAEALGKKAIDKAKTAISTALKLNPTTAPIAAVADAAGILRDGNECGDLDFVCKLKEWIKDSNFFQRFGLVIVAILFILGALLLLARAQTGRVISTVKNVKDIMA